MRKSTALIVAVITVFWVSWSVLSAAPQTSEATIEFQANTNPTTPVNPDNPGENSGETGTGAAGPLSIDYVSPISFGTGLNISPTEQVYNTVTAKPYIQITDNRGTGAGWKVTASASSFKKGEVNTLNGAFITLSSGSPLSVNPALAAPAVESSIKLTTDGSSKTVVTAAAGTGMGTWVNRWYPTTGPNSYVTLTVPAGVATTGTHTAVITWELTDAP